VKTKLSELIDSSGKPKKWYAEQLDYAVESRTSSFQNVVNGLKLPSAERRKQLADLLSKELQRPISVRDVWVLDENTGRVVAITC